MNVLVIGGTGFISGEVVRLSIEAGHQVTVFNRGSAETPPEVRAIRGDVVDLVAFKDQILQASPDVVIHAIADTEKASQDLIEVFQGHPAQILVLSSVDCYEAFTQVNRGREVSGFPLDEDAPLSSVPYYFSDLVPGRELYDKNLMTAVLLGGYALGAIKPTIFRCPMVYGPQDRQYLRRHGRIVRRILDQHPTLLIGQNEQGRLHSAGFVTNIAAAIVHAYGRPEAVGQVYNLGETTTRTKRLWATLFGRAAGLEFDFEVLPDELLENDPSVRNLPPTHLMFDCNLSAGEKVTPFGGSLGTPATA